MPKRLRIVIASLAASVVLAGGLAGSALADLPEPGWGAYQDGTVAVFGNFAELEAAGFVTQVSPGVYRAGNYDRTKFSVLMIENWTTYENKRFVDRVITARAPLLMMSPITRSTLWSAARAKETIYYRELIRLRAGGYPIGHGSIYLPNGLFTSLPESPPQILTHPQTAALNPSLIALTKDPAVLRHIGRAGGALLYPVVIRGLINSLVERGLMSFDTGSMTVEAVACVESMLYLDSSVSSAVQGVVRGVGRTFTIGSAVITGALACKTQLEALGITLDNTTLGLLHVANCLATASAAAATAGLALVLAVITCLNDMDMAAQYLEGTALDRALGKFIGVLLFSQPLNSPYRKIDPDLAGWLNAQFPGPPLGRVTVDYLPGVAVQVTTREGGTVRVSVTRIQLKAMMVGYKVTGIVLEGPDVGKRIEVDPFPPEFVAWCRTNPAQCLVDGQGVFVAPSPKQVHAIVKQARQQAVGGSAPARLARLDPPSEAALQMKLPETQKAVVTSSYNLCNRPDEAFGCGGQVPAPRPGQEPPPPVFPTTGTIGGTVQQDRVEVQLTQGIATRMTINGQPVTGTYAITDSAGRYVVLTMADGNVAMTYIPDNDMAIRATTFGWVAMWTDAHGRTWTAKARPGTTGFLDVYEVSTVIEDPATGNKIQVTLRMNANAGNPQIASESLVNQKTGTELFVDRASGLTYRTYTLTHPDTEEETRVLEVYRNGQLQSREIISGSGDGNGEPEDNFGFYFDRNPATGAPITCIKMAGSGGDPRLLCDRGDGVYTDPADPFFDPLPDEDFLCGKYGLGAMYSVVDLPNFPGCAGSVYGWASVRGIMLEAWIQSHLTVTVNIPVIDPEALAESLEQYAPQVNHGIWTAHANDPPSYTAVDTDSGEPELRAGEYVTLTGSGLADVAAWGATGPDGCQDTLRGRRIVLLGEHTGGGLIALDDDGFDGPAACVTYVSPTEVRFRIGDNVPSDRYMILLTTAGELAWPYKHTEPVTIAAEPTAPRVAASGTVHRSTYLPGQVPRYTITGGPPNKPICWHSTKDGVPQEVNACYGQSTNALGDWTGTRPAWQAGDAGTWVRRATVDGRTSSTGTSANVRVVPQCEYTWTGLAEFTDGARFAGCSGTFRFAGGNLVIEDDHGAPWWGAGSGHSPPGKLVFEGTYFGTLTVYDAANQARWSAGVIAGSGSRLTFQSDGNLVIYNAGSQPVWSSGTVGGGPIGASLAADKTTYRTGETPTYTVTGPPNQPILWSSWKNGGQTEFSAFYYQYTDASGRWSGPGPEAWSSAHIGTWTRRADVGVRSAQVGFTVGQCDFFWSEKLFYPDDYFTGCKGTLIMQSDGNLVIYHEYGWPLWATGTAGYPGAYAVFQSDGNLVVYTVWGYPLWSSGTAGYPGSTLAFQSDGNLVIYASWGWPIWASNTAH